MNETERYSRQEEVVPHAALEALSVSVVGVGAVGRNLALQLASMGVSKLHLIDFDKVEESNVCTQGYLEGDIGEYKVEAVKKHCLLINGQMKVYLDPTRFRKNMELGNVVFSCVDTMRARKIIFEAIRDRMDLFIDGRMTSETFRVLTVIPDEESIKHYESSLFNDEEANQGSCTSKSTIYCASGLACFEAQALAKWLRGMPLQKDILLNLLSNELYILKE